MDGDRRTAWWIAGVSLAVLALGFLAVILLTDDSPRTPTPPRYIEMRKLDVQSTQGLVVLSLDLEVDRGDLARVELQKGALETSFRAALTQLDPARMYSRRGKEALAAGLRDVANQTLGENLITGVYFGDFKIYDRTPK